MIKSHSFTQSRTQNTQKGTTKIKKKTKRESERTKMREVLFLLPGLDFIRILGIVEVMSVLHLQVSKECLLQASKECLCYKQAKKVGR